MLLETNVRSEFPNEILRDLFRLNPPLLNIFSSDNYRRWSIGTGVGVLTLIWSIYFGNSAAIMLRGTLQASATSSPSRSSVHLSS
jgi:hypothetical protein